MYRMKNIITFGDELNLPDCMYRVKKLQSTDPCEDDVNINIRNQVMKLLKSPNKAMADLEQRQDLLLKKLDVLYDKIQSISSMCKLEVAETAASVKSKACLPVPEELVLNLNPDSLPWFLNKFLKEIPNLNVSWHIHSSVSNGKVPKIKAFVKNLKTGNNAINLRLIFTNVSAGAELKLSSLGVPIIGHVNILRYLSYVFPNVASYDHGDHVLESLLDLCHVLEITPEKNKEAVTKKIFAQHKEWIYINNFTIVDLAAYNVVKQWQNSTKYVPKSWFDKCERVCL